ncbi:hypothetical protein PCARR_a0746 [Pseudoalteromonas carrageenovora IAM 12662]|uniref:Uncharacterized protein n=1 Tax=Pseudoalteromonas carrageenovora IAM 12662 TaxID=1314868 RepID=A0ABR9EQ85_PSEVC|nr:hypothetical protein [Pseudoalteromonas carrageenovora IAM 12662]
MHVKSSLFVNYSTLSCTEFNAIIETQNLQFDSLFFVTES